MRSLSPLVCTTGQAHPLRGCLDEAGVYAGIAPRGKHAGIRFNGDRKLAPITELHPAAPAGSIRRSLLAVAALAVTLLAPLAAPAQDVTEPALKAAFIYTFMKFTVWPEPLPASNPFVICVLGDPAVSGALERVVKDREFAGRRMTVSLIEMSGTRKPCNVLYLSSVTTSQRGQLLAELQDTPVLTISDLAGFTQAGGMAQFFFEGSRLRFDIGLEAVKRSRLQMSSNLLVLARRHE